MSKKKTKREARRAAQQRKKLVTNLIWAGVGVAVFAVVALLLWNAFRPATGEAVPVMANAGDHVPEGADPGPFNSDPPTSGPHYAQEFDAGFYDESSTEAQLDYPEGYIIHNLEHGYVIFWYNCNLLDEADCDQLKGQIKGVMDEFDGFKVIGFPRDSIDEPLVMTSWGQIQRFERFDAEQSRRFIRANRNRAPEPNAP